MGREEIFWNVWFLPPKMSTFSGKIVQTVSMGYLPGRLAAHFNLEFEETGVGYKHIAQKILEEKVLFGGEESGGFGVGLWSPERDGLLCSLLLIEMIEARKMPLS